MRSSTRYSLWLTVLSASSLFAWSNENNGKAMIENFNVQFKTSSSMDVEQGELTKPRLSITSNQNIKRLYLFDDS